MTGPLDLPPDAPVCASGKRPFRTEDDARRQLGIARSGRRAGAVGRRPDAVEAAVYECPACSWWHLSSTTGPQRRSVLSATKRGARRRRG